MVESETILRRATQFASEKKQILYLSFSWDQNFICVGTVSGYALYSKDNRLIEYEGTFAIGRTKGEKDQRSSEE